MKQPSNPLTGSNRDLNRGSVVPVLYLFPSVDHIEVRRRLFGTPKVTHG